VNADFESVVNFLLAQISASECNGTSLATRRPACIVDVMADSMMLPDGSSRSCVTPSSIAELSTVIRSHPSVMAVGGGTALSLRMPPSNQTILICTKQLNQVIDYPHDDMTVTVQAGLTIAELQSLLATKNQMLPVDFALPGTATIGGAVAVNASGSRRFGHGTLRDYLIGISFVSDSGEEVKAGGRVVKNVAGYDLMKLLLGSFGCFGIITQLTFKVKPRPESFAIASFEIESAQLTSTLDQLHASDSRPIAVDIINLVCANSLKLNSTQPWTVLCSFEENLVNVDWQLSTLKKEIGQPLTINRDESARSILSGLTHLPCVNDHPYNWRTIVRPSEVAGVLRKQNDGMVIAHALSGIIETMTSQAHRPHENSVARKMPIESNRRELFEPTVLSDTFLRERIRKHLDPHGKFPG
jgi:glycolate oxidase FAD binding subunit